MLSLDKREKFIKRLNISKGKKNTKIDLNKNIIKVNKNSHIKMLFESLEKKYTIGQKNKEFIKMEVKKQYY